MLIWNVEFFMYDLWCCFEMLIDSKGGGWGFELGRGRQVGVTPLPW